MSDGFTDFSFGDNDGTFSGGKDRYKGEKGRIDRISLAWWSIDEEGKLEMDADKPNFRGCERHYVPGVGYVMNRGPDFTKVIGEPPKKVVGTIVVWWPTDREGEVDLAAIAKGKARVWPWTFDPGKYSNLKANFKEFPPGKHDFLVSCTDSQYQKLTFSACRESLLRKLMENPKTAKVYEKLVAEIQAVVGNINGHLANVMDLDTLRKKMAGASAGGTSSGNGDASKALTDEAIGEEIDDLVEGLLD